MLQILRKQLFLTHGAVFFSTKATRGLVSNGLVIPCVPLLLHCLSSLLLSLSHCMIFSAAFCKVSIFSPFPPGSSIQESIPLKKLSYNKTHLKQDLHDPASTFSLFWFFYLSHLLAPVSQDLSEKYDVLSHVTILL